MPRSIASYAFEHGLHAWAEHFRGGDGFLAVFGPQGEVAEAYVAEAAQSGKRLVSHELKERVTREHASWMFYDPFDWLESGPGAVACSPRACSGGRTHPSG